MRLSSKGSQINVYMKALRELPDTRLEAVERARARIEQPVSSAALADALLGFGRIR